MRITLHTLMQGSDAVMLPRLRAGMDETLLAATDENLHTFSVKGLRTLVIASKVCVDNAGSCKSAFPDTEISLYSSLLCCHILLGQCSGDAAGVWKRGTLDPRPSEQKDLQCCGSDLGTRQNILCRCSALEG